jgi:hypothetical protein
MGILEGGWNGGLEKEGLLNENFRGRLERRFRERGFVEWEF